MEIDIRPSDLKRQRPQLVPQLLPLHPLHVRQPLSFYCQDGFLLLFVGSLVLALKVVLLFLPLLKELGDHLRLYCFLTEGLKLALFTSVEHHLFDVLSLLNLI